MPSRRRPERGRRKPTPREQSGYVAAARVLRDLRRESKAAQYAKQPRPTPTHQVREIRVGVPATALRRIRDGIARARNASAWCAQLLRNQAGDYDLDIALTLRRCVSIELFHQMGHIDLLLKEDGDR